VPRAPAGKAAAILSAALSLCSVFNCQRPDTSERGLMSAIGFVPPHAATATATIQSFFMTVIRREVRRR
jgi:hypothetical protein